MKSKLAMKQTARDNLEIRCDGNEQDSRRSYVCIHGLDFNSDENNNLMEKAERCCRDMDTEFIQNEIDCAHYIGKSFIDKKKKKKLDQLLLNSGHGNQEQPFTKPDQGTT